MFWVGLLIGVLVGAVGMGWLCTGKVDKVQAEYNALLEQIRNRTSMGE